MLARVRVSSVIGLLCYCGPPTIAWCVVAVIVDTVDAMSGGRSRPEVGEEALETGEAVFAVPPSCADLDAPSAIVSVTNVIRVLATGD